MSTQSHKTRLSLLALLMLALVALPVIALAQRSEGGTINYGDTVQGEITTDTYEFAYTFDGAAGDVVVINMTAINLPVDGPRLDSFLELRGPDGATLRSNDDYFSLDSQIGPFLLPEDGAYTIVATRFMRDEGPSTGEFELALARVELAPIATGETFTVELGDSNRNAYFAYTAAEAGQLMRLRAERAEDSGNFNIGIMDLSSTDTRYENRGYPTESGVAVVDPAYLSTAGDYLIEIRLEPDYPPSVDPNQQSQPVYYPLTVTFSMEEVEAAPIGFGETITGTLNDQNPAVYYRFNASPDDLLRLVGEETSEGDPFEIMLIAPEGYFFGGGNTEYNQTPGMFVIDPVQVQSAGEHVMVVRRLDTTGLGTDGNVSSYRVTLSATETPLLEAGVAVQDNVDSVSVFERVFRYEGQAGQTVRITITSLNDTYGPGLFVTAPMGDAGAGAAGIGGGGGGGGGFLVNISGARPGTATYEVELPVTGVYLFRVTNGYTSQPMPTESGTVDTDTVITGEFSLLVEVIE
jgi:hypothetical protein